MYVTTGLDAKTTEISTGIVMVPQGRPGVDRKVVSYQEANDSVGGNCHPSGQWTGQNPMDGASWSALGPLAIMFNKGYTVTISDVGNNGDKSPHGVFAGRKLHPSQHGPLEHSQAGPESVPASTPESWPESETTTFASRPASKPASMGDPPSGDSVSDGEQATRRTRTRNRRIGSCYGRGSRLSPWSRSTEGE